MVDSFSLTQSWIAIGMYIFTLVIIVPIQSISLYKYTISSNIKHKNQFPEMIKWINIIILSFWLVYHPLRFLIDISPFSFIYPHEAEILRQIALHLWNFLFWATFSLGISRYFLLHDQLQLPTGSHNDWRAYLSFSGKHNKKRNKIRRTSFLLFLFFFLCHSTFQVIFYCHRLSFTQYGISWNYVNGIVFIIPITFICLLWRYAPSQALKSELRISAIYGIIIVPVCTVIDECNFLDDIQSDIDLYQLSSLHSDAFKYNHWAHRCQSNLKRCIIGDCALSLAILGYILLMTCYFPSQFSKHTSINNTDNNDENDLELQSFVILRTITLSQILQSDTHFLSFIQHFEQNEPESLGVVLCYIEMIQFKVMVDSTFNLCTKIETSRSSRNDGFQRISLRELQIHDCEYYQYGIINNSAIPESQIVYHSNEHESNCDFWEIVYILYYKYINLDERELEPNIKVRISDTMRSCYEMDMSCDLNEFINKMGGEGSDIGDLFEYFDPIIEDMYHSMEKSLRLWKSIKSVRNHPIMEESLSITNNLMQC